jgi:hypothetical protein
LTFTLGAPLTLRHRSLLPSRVDEHLPSKSGLYTPRLKKALLRLEVLAEREALGSDLELAYLRVVRAAAGL